MILLPLLLAGLAGARAARVDDQARRRLHELRGRLGVVPERTVPGLRARVAWALAFLEEGRPSTGQVALDQAMFLGCVHQLYNRRTVYAMQRTTEQGFAPEDRDLALEGLIPALARWVKQGIRIGDLPWDEAWGWPQTAVTMPSVETAIAPPGSLRDLRDKLYRDRVPFAMVFARGALYDPSAQIVGPEDRFDARVNLLTYVNGDSTEYLIGYWIFYEHVLPMVLDWVEQEHPDLSRLSFAQAVQAAQAWHRTLGVHTGQTGQARRPVRRQAGDREIRRFPDGATIVSLRTRQSLVDEGESLSHCVGGYWPRVRDGQTVIWSYRDANGVPQLTLEVDPHDLSVRQIHGVDDLIPTPDGMEKDPPLFHAALRLCWTWLQVREGGLDREPEDRDEVRDFGLPRPSSPDARLSRLSAWLEHDATASALASLIDAVGQGSALQQRAYVVERTLPWLTTSLPGVFLGKLDEGTLHFEPDMIQIEYRIPQSESWLVVLSYQRVGFYKLYFRIGFNTRRSSGAHLYSLGDTAHEALADMQDEVQEALRNEAADSSLPNTRLASVFSWMQDLAQRAGVAWP